MEHVTHSIFKKILLSGGGTGGSVSPLLAIAEELNNAPLTKGVKGDFKFLWLGTKNGVEKEMIASASLSTGERGSIEFKAISSGKLRRYFSFKNITDLFLILAGFFQSFFIILKWKPNLIMSAGSFASVPAVWAGWILRVPILIHQQDVLPGLANKLMAPFAKIITVTFEESLKDYGKKAVWTGNPSRNMEHITHNARAPLIKGVGGFENNLPVILIIGGGTGAMAINELVWRGLDELTKFCNIIHITGKNKGIFSVDNEKNNNYQSFEFLNSSQMAESYAAADIVISRAGMGVLTELSYLGKPTILIPMPDSHQEENAEIFEKNEAVIALNQKNLTSENFVANIKQLLANEALKNKLSENIKKVIKKDANREIIKIINQIIK